MSTNPVAGSSAALALSSSHAVTDLPTAGGP